MTYELNDPVSDYDLGLPGEVHVSPDADTLFDDLGMVFTSLGVEADDDRGVFHIAACQRDHALALCINAC
ncbi:MAG: hypothetical protein R3C45_07550 [Phycisphaerales bacterium]